MKQKNSLLIAGVLIILSALLGFLLFLPSKQSFFNTKTEPSSSTETEEKKPEIFTAEDGQVLEEAIVTKVIDGDTVEINGSEQVRYIGINTPEISFANGKADCYGEEARRANEELVGGKKVWLEKDVSETDKYGRLLRYVWSWELMINEYLVAQGFANIATYPPDVKHQERLLNAQKEAVLNKSGLWKDCSN